MNSMMLPETIQAYGIELRCLQRDDIELVRQWRNHPEVARHMLTSEHISQEQQVVWFAQVDTAIDRAYYMTCYRGEPTAFASVTGDPGRSLAENDNLEAAIYLAPDSRCRGTLLAFAPALALNDACFKYLACKQLTARVKAENNTALRFNRQMGYRETRRNGGLVYMQLNQGDYQTACKQIKQLLSRNQTVMHSDTRSETRT